MKLKFTVHLLSLGLLVLATSGASAKAAAAASSAFAFAQADTMGSRLDSTAVMPDTVTATPDSVMKTPVAPAPAAAPAVAPVTTTPAPAAAPLPATTPAPAAPAAASSGEANKIYYGGTVTFSFGTTTRIGFFPMIGYKVSPKLSAGAEIGYEYVSYNFNEFTSNYGGSLFGRYRVGRALYAHAEYQAMNYEIFTGTSSNREWVPALLLGGGMVKPLGGRSAAYVEVLFDVLQDKNSPYTDWTPVVNVGVSVGF